MTHIKVNTNPWQYPNICFTCHHMRRIKFEFRPTQIDFIRWFLNLCATNKGVNPPRLQILRIDGDWVIDDVIMQGTWRHFLEKNARKRCCFNCNIWPNWFTFHQSHYCLSYNGIPECVWKRSLLTEKYLKQCKIFDISLSESRIYKKEQTSAIIREISDSNLETGRNSLKSGVSRIIRESWQPWTNTDNRLVNWR